METAAVWNRVPGGVFDVPRLAEAILHPVHRSMGARAEVLPSIPCDTVMSRPNASEGLIREKGRVEIWRR